MPQKELLLIDLSARLFYGVKVCIKIPNHQEKIFEEQIGDLKELTRYGGYLVNSKGIDYRSFNLDIKPYLRPMSSMTEEENKKRIQLGILRAINSNHEMIFDGFGNESVDTQLRALDWLNAHHFDYRGLIEKGLALEAPKDMYK